MYEQEIAELLNIDPAHGFQEAAIETAIALMKAAQPKDAEAELRHCQKVRHEFATGREALITVLLRERQDARAEVESRFVAERAELCILRKDRDDWKARALAAEAELKKT